MRILYVITDLGTGGAEMMLLKLLSASARNFDSAVVSLGGEGKIGPQISRLGVPVFSLGLRTAVPSPLRILSLRSIVRKFHPSLVAGWMYHGNIMATLARRWAPRRPPLVWNIRQSLYDLGYERRRTAAIIRLGARLSRHPAAIVYNSNISVQQHEACGYSAEHRVVIPNGFDCQTFKPDPAARQSVRKELGLDANALLVGLVARYHPMKDHAGFLKAAGCVAQRHPDIYFLLAGAGVTPEQMALKQIISTEQLQGRIFLLGERSDLPRLTASFDVACSASAWGEGFSNAIGEAMASGVPCVVTNIGDSALLVGNAGVSVQPENPQAMTEAICSLIQSGEEHRKKLGTEARQRIQHDYSIDFVARRFEDLYRSLAEPPISARGRSTT